MSRFKILIGLLVILLFLAGGIVSFSKEKVYVYNFNNFNENLKITQIKNELIPKICEPRVWEINLSKNLIYFFENCKLKGTIPIAYQSPSDVWYKTPTGYYRIGIKREKFISSLFPVYMNYAVQLYEDFFIHEIPYYLDGRKVDSNFTGGCIRLEKDDAKKFYELVKSGDLVVSYLEIDNLKVKNGFVFPVNKDQFFIRQRFNSPLRATWTYSQDRRVDYIQHAGVDLAPNLNAEDFNVYSASDGKIVKIVRNGADDHGMGNVVIIETTVSDRNLDLPSLYFLYAHLDSINANLKEGDFVKAGTILGKVGATAYGCNYWRIGEDGCDKNTNLDKHLHFEIKIKPVLESPIEAKCLINGSWKKCYGYTPEDPTKYGYFDPLKFISDGL